MYSRKCKERTQTDNWLSNADRPTKHEQMNDLPSQNYLFQWLEVFGNGQSSLKKKKEKLCQNWVFFFNILIHKLQSELLN